MNFLVLRLASQFSQLSIRFQRRHLTATVLKVKISLWEFLAFIPRLDKLLALVSFLFVIFLNLKFRHPQVRFQFGWRTRSWDKVWKVGLRIYQKNKKKKTKTVKDKAPPKEKQKTLWDTAIKNAPLDEPSDYAWSDVLTLNPKEVFDTATKFYGLERLEDFRKSYNEAKKSWKCKECNHYDDVHMKSELIYCDLCNIWRHKICAIKVPNKPMVWKCGECKGEMVDKGDTENPKNSTNQEDSEDDFQQEQYITHKGRKRQ